MWELVEALVNNTPCSPDNMIAHINDLRKVALSKAKTLESSKGLMGTGQGKKDDRLLVRQTSYVHYLLFDSAKLGVYSCIIILLH